MSESVSTDRCELIGRSAVMQQQVDDVRVSLLCSLMERRVTVLQSRPSVSVRQHVHSQQHTVYTQKLESPQSSKEKNTAALNGYLGLSVDLRLIL